VLVLNTNTSAAIFAIELREMPTIGAALFVVRPENDTGVMQLSLLDRKVDWSWMAGKPPGHRVLHHYSKFPG
jgi:hypothetical protein